MSGIGTDNGSGPRPKESFLGSLSNKRDMLTASERMVADHVLAHPEAIIRMSIASLAKTVGVSQPTVLRFVRSIGLSSYPELKLQTGQSLALGTPYVHSDVMYDDTIQNISDKIIDSNILALTELRHSIDQLALSSVIEALVGARRVDCFGTGAARILASEAQQKLMRFAVPVISYDDTHIQRLAAATLQPGDVALCISHTGMVKDTVKMARKARECGATVICITKANTALAQESDIVLAIDTHENTEIYAPMTSRVAHATLIDIITTAIAVRGGPSLFTRLRDAKDSLSDLRLPIEPETVKKNLKKRKT